LFESVGVAGGPDDDNDDDDDDASAAGTVFTLCFLCVISRRRNDFPGTVKPRAPPWTALRVVIVIVGNMMMRGSCVNQTPSRV
jgi:hypothetical protein